MLQRILVAIDGSELAHNALLQAIELAKALRCDIRALYVNVDPFVEFPLLAAVNFQDDQVLQAVAEQTSDIRQTAERAFDAGGIKGDVQVLELTVQGKRIADLIKVAATQWDADLVVLGSHGLRGVQRLMLGSVAEQYLRIADRPVLIVKS